MPADALRDALDAWPGSLRSPEMFAGEPRSHHAPSVDDRLRPCGWSNRIDLSGVKGMTEMILWTLDGWGGKGPPAGESEPPKDHSSIPVRSAMDWLSRAKWVIR
jgi:hypothetical protein